METTGGFCSELSVLLRTEMYYILNKFMIVAGLSGYFFIYIVTDMVFVMQQLPKYMLHH
jgi:hypothetical protein